MGGGRKRKGKVGEKESRRRKEGKWKREEGKRADKKREGKG